MTKEDSLALEIYIELVAARKTPSMKYEDLCVSAVTASKVWWRMWEEEKCDQADQ